jgi:hypothetical protein
MTVLAMAIIWGLLRYTFGGHFLVQSYLSATNVLLWLYIAAAVFAWAIYLGLIGYVTRALVSLGAEESGAGGAVAGLAIGGVAGLYGARASIICDACKIVGAYLLCHAVDTSQLAPEWNSEFLIIGALLVIAGIILELRTPTIWKQLW